MAWRIARGRYGAEPLISVPARASSKRAVSRETPDVLAVPTSATIRRRINARRCRGAVGQPGDVSLVDRLRHC